MKRAKLSVVVLLLLAMVLTMLPVTALATGVADDVTPAPVEETVGTVQEEAAAPQEEEMAAPAVKSSESGISVQSMLPLKEIHKELDLTGYLPHELEAFPVAKLVELLGMEKTPAVWAKYDYLDANKQRWVSTTDGFTAFDGSGTINLNANEDSFQLEVIAGTADQLALDNVRYVVTVKITPMAKFFVPTIYTENREKVTIYENEPPVTYYRGYHYVYIRHFIDGTLFPDTSNVSDAEAIYYLGLTLNSVFQGVHVKAIDESSGNDVTSELFDNTDMSVSGGMKRNWVMRGDITFTLWRDGESEASEFVIAFDPYPDRRSLRSEDIYVEQDGYRESAWWTRNSYVAAVTDGVADDENIHVPHIGFCYMLKPGLDANGTYYVNLQLDVPGNDKDDNGLAYVKKAVEGFYLSEATIPASVPDIKEQLFSDPQNGGYAADFSKDEVKFTVVDTDGKLYYYGIKTESYSAGQDYPAEYTSLDVYGARKAEVPGNVYSAYSAFPVTAADDSYYNNGYQTVFLLDGTYDEETDQQRYFPLTADSIRPEFYASRRTTVYASTDGGSGVKQISGQTKIPFTSGKAVQYSVAAENGQTVANYWVTFLTQQSGGPKLFVNATNEIGRAHV